MNPLPQRRKTAEELAKLREDLGIPAEAPSSYSAMVPPPAPLPPPKPATAITNRTPAALEIHGPEETVLPPAREPKPVRSLRRSERIPPLEPHPRAIASASPIPSVRHSDAELQEIRRLSAIRDLQHTPPDFRMTPARPAVLTAAYLFAATGIAISMPQVYRHLVPSFFTLGGLQMTHPILFVAAAESLALIIALWVWLRRLYSRHHSGFLAIIAFFTLFFATLHFFPRFLHGS
ncbi:MAG: hypothetical protein V4733_09435 [Verrucomicrobiota bacterium]